MVKFKKVTSVLMTFVLALYMLSSAGSGVGAVPAYGVTVKVTKAAAKKQITKATGLVKQAEGIVAKNNFNVANAKTAYGKAQTEVVKIGTYGKSYKTSYTGLVKRMKTVSDKISKQTASAQIANAGTLVTQAESTVFDFNFDVAQAKIALTKADAQVQKLKTLGSSATANYKALAKRVKAVSAKIDNQARQNELDAASDLVGKAENAVFNDGFDVNAAKALFDQAYVEVQKIGTYGGAYLTGFGQLSKRLIAVSNKISAGVKQQAYQKQVQGVEQVIEKLEGLTASADTLVKSEKAMLDAQNALKTANETVVLLQKTDANYKGFAARINLAAAVIAKAVDQRNSASAEVDKNTTPSGVQDNPGKTTPPAVEVDPAVAVEELVKKAESAPLNSAADVAAARQLCNTAEVGIKTVKNQTTAIAFEDRLKKVLDQADIKDKYLAADEAVKAAEAGKLDVYGDVTAVKALIAKAMDSVSKVADPTDLSGFNARILQINDKINILETVELVEELEKASYTTATDLTTGQLGEKRAEDAVATLKDQNLAASLNERLSAIKDKLTVLAADVCVKNVEQAPLATAQDLDAIVPIETTAMDAISKLKDDTLINTFKDRMKAVADREAALKDKLAADAKAEADAAKAKKDAQDAADKAAREAEEAAARAKQAAEDEAARIAAIPAKLVTVNAGAGLITIVFDKKPKTAVGAADLYIGVSINGGANNTVSPSAISVIDDRTLSISIPKLDAISSIDQTAVYAVQYSTQAAVTASAITIPKLPIITLSSITPLNQKQIIVKFSKKVDRASAENISNYSENGVVLQSTYAKAELQSDGQSVLITFASPKSQQAVASFTVANVRNVEFTEQMAETPMSATFLDTTLPTISNIRMIGNKCMSIVFSEPVDGADSVYSYKLDGYDLGNYGVSSIAYDDQGTPSKHNSVTINFNSRLTAAPHTFTVVGGKIKDSVGFPVVETTNTINVLQDTTKPLILSAVSSGLGVLDLTFNKEVLLPAASNIYINGVVVSSSALVSYKAGDKTTVEIVKTGLLQAGTNMISIPLLGITDYFGNLNDVAPIQFSVNVLPDTVPPTVTGLVAVDDKTLMISYSEGMDINSTNLANYSIKNANGNPVAILGTIKKASSTDSTVTLNLSSPLAGGMYTISIAGATDLAGNPVTAVSKTFTVVDTTKPLAPTAVMANSIMKRVKVIFSEPMDQTSITKPEDYQVAFTGGNTLASYQALGPNVTITPDSDNRSVTLDFPDDAAIVPGVTTLRTIMIKDQAGNYTEAVSDAPIAISPTTALTSTFLRAKAISQNQLQLEYNAPLSNVEANDFSYNGITALSATNAYAKVLASDNTTQVDGSVVTLTFSAGTIGSDAGGALTATAPIGTFDTYANVVATGTLASYGTVIDKIPPKLLRVNIVDNNTVDVYFDENMQTGLALLFANDLNVYNGSASPIAVTASSVLGNIVRLSLASPLNRTQTTFIIPKAAPAYLQDMKGNKYVPTQSDLAGCQAQ